jgi:hypothetical protein
MITELYAFIAQEPDGEGIAAFSNGIWMLPMVTADLLRVEQLRPIAQQIADTSGCTITLRRFALLEGDAGVFVPGKER